MTARTTDGQTSAASSIPLAEFEVLWFSLTPLRTIAQKFNTTPNGLYAFARRHGLPTDRSAQTQNNVIKKARKALAKTRKKLDDSEDDADDDSVNPSPEEIERITAEIRDRWDEHDFRRSVEQTRRPVSMRTYLFDGRTTSFALLED
jgi:hypothetical protein